jgi:hypothetical protein
MTAMLTRCCAAVVTALALLGALAVTAPPAQADDSSARKTRYVLTGDPYQRVGAKTAKQLKAAESINKHATGPKRKVLDYKLADKYDKGQTTTRRQFAASWLWSGKRVKNISAKERKVVRGYVKTYFGKRKPTPKASGSSDLRTDEKNYCRGRGGFESLGGGE